MGRAIALEFAKEGCHLAITYLKSADQAQYFAKELEQVYVTNVMAIQAVMISPFLFKHSPRADQPGIFSCSISEEL